MSRPERSVDADTIRRAAIYAGLPLQEDQVEMQLDRLRDILGFVKEWESVKLGYWFDNETGEFGHAPNVNQYRIPWEYSTPLTKNRVIKND